jgi:hypothetical protein
MSNRLVLLARWNHITQKVLIAAQRTLYLSVHNDARPAEKEVYAATLWGTITSNTH